MRIRLSATTLLAAALWGSVLFAPALQAQDAKRVALQAAPLTKDGLKSMLDALGYDPHVLGEGYVISLKRDTWTYSVMFTISADVSKIGMNANLGSVDKPDDVTAAQWRALLEENSVVDPSAFYYNKEQKKLWIHRVLDNRGLTSTYVRDQIESFCANIHDTEDLWKFAK